MSVRLMNVDAVKEYMNGVLARSEHHADSVGKVAPALMGYALAYQDPGIPMRVWGQEGAMKNVLFFQVDNVKYCFTYNHENQSIMLRMDGLQGQDVFEFDNDSEISTIWDVFQALRS